MNNTVKPEFLYEISANVPMQRSRWAVIAEGQPPTVASSILWEDFKSSRPVTYRGEDLIMEQYEFIPEKGIKAWHLYFRLPRSAGPYTALRVIHRYVYRTPLT